MKFDNYLFRASSCGHLMTSPVSKADKEAGNLSEGAKTNLVDCYVSAKYGRQTDISNKYIQKGNMVEEDAITLYSRLKKIPFKKNVQHLKNDFLKGTPDLFTGLEISEADEIIDIKSSWDLYTFSRVRTKDINPIYYWQLQAYMALTGAHKARLAYCLVNTPQSLIEEEKRRLFYKMNVPTMENPDYLEACEALEKSMVYDDIPLKERFIEFEVERDNDGLGRLYKKINKCREFLNEYEMLVCGTELITA